MPYPVVADTFHHVAVRPPVERPIHHVMIRRPVNYAWAPGAFVGVMDIDQPQGNGVVIGRLLLRDGSLTDLDPHFHPQSGVRFVQDVSTEANGIADLSDEFVAHILQFVITGGPAFTSITDGDLGDRERHRVSEDSRLPVRNGETHADTAAGM